MSSNTRLGIAALILLAVGTLTACGDSDAVDTDRGEDDMAATTGPLVCGLVDVDLVKQVTGDAEIGTRGHGITDKAHRTLEPANCTVQSDSQTVLQLLIGEVADPEHMRKQLDDEAAGEPDCRRYSGDPGVGYGCTYDSGVFVDGAGVNVLRDDRLIRVTVHHWPGVTSQQRLALAEDIARDIDRNVTAYDESRAG